uniref:Uncharacterized protein n=1 Tax=Crocodylus porosus TaxID=8502 RepID=A0A7M4E9R9_CROPO
MLYQNALLSTFTLAPDTSPNSLACFTTLPKDTSSRTTHVMSSIYRRTFNSPPLGTRTPLITLSLLIRCASGSMAHTKSPGDSGHPCLTPESTAKASPRKPLTSTLLVALP